VNVASEGDTEPEAIDNLREGLELYFEDADDYDAPPVTHAHVDSLTLKSA
jgi:predicted RNase H-like HicB family nuclease